MDAQKREDFLWCGLALALTILVRGLTLDLLPPFTSSGDMGRDLYAFWMVLEGKSPCRDFWWVYGPLMPLYYAFWFFVGGVHLISLQVGLIGLYLAMVLISFWTLRLFVPPSAAFLASLAFLSFDPMWTYNHIGVIPFLLVGIFFLWKFFTSARVHWCYLGTFAFIGAALIKLNIGCAFFLAFFLSLLLFRLRWKHLFLLSLIFGVSVVGIYLFMYRGLPLSWIDQCMIVRPVYRRDRTYPIWTNMKHMIMLFLFWRRDYLAWIGGCLGLAFLSLRYFKKQNLSTKEQQTRWAAAGSLVLFFLLGLTDYLIMSDNVRTRVTFWNHPILILFLGLTGGWAISPLRQPKRTLVYLLVFLWIIGVPLGVMGDQNFLTVSDLFHWRTPERYFDFPHGRAYIGGGPPYEQWNQTIKQVTHYIRENTAPDEKILALPMEPLFLFLSGRRQAIWQLMLTEDHRAPEPYEDEIIRTLERESVRYVILSNSGSFGIESYQKTARYIFENYEVVQTFGSWGADSAQEFGVKILRKKQ